jgi:hypothetical protein
LIDDEVLLELFPENKFIGKVLTISRNFQTDIISNLYIYRFIDLVNSYLASFKGRFEIELVQIENIGSIESSTFTDIFGGTVIVRSSTNRKIFGSIYKVNELGKILVISEISEKYIPSREHLNREEKRLFGTELSKGDESFGKKENVTLFNDRYLSVEYSNNDTLGVLSLFDILENKLLLEVYSFYRTSIFRDDTLNFYSPIFESIDSARCVTVPVYEWAIVNGEILGARKRRIRLNHKIVKSKTIRKKV